MTMIGNMPAMKVTVIQQPGQVTGDMTADLVTVDMKAMTVTSHMTA